MLATKVAGRSKDMKYLRGGPRLSADHIKEAIENSLERDNFMKPNEAKKFGLIDNVVTERNVDKK